MSEHKRRPKRLIDELPNLAYDALFVIGAAFILAVSIGICEVIVTCLVRFIEWFSHEKLPVWFHITLICILCASLILLELFIFVMHFKGMKIPQVEETTPELPFDKPGDE